MSKVSKHQKKIPVEKTIITYKTENRYNIEDLTAMQIHNLIYILNKYNNKVGCMTTVTQEILTNLMKYEEDYLND